MFVYQNKDGHICVTFTSNKPVEAPEYVIAIDETAKALYMVSGTIEAMPEKEEVVEEPAVVIELPKVEELDDVTENDAVIETAPVVEPVYDAPALEDIREKSEEEPKDFNDKAPVTDADSTGAPTVEELDDIAENDPVVEEIVEDETTEDETDEEVPTEE